MCWVFGTLTDDLQQISRYQYMDEPRDFRQTILLPFTFIHNGEEDESLEPPRTSTIRRMLARLCGTVCSASVAGCIYHSQGIQSYHEVALQVQGVLLNTFEEP